MKFHSRGPEKKNRVNNYSATTMGKNKTAETADRTALLILKQTI